MNRSETQNLIQLIESFSGTSWPAGSADAWLTLLGGTDAADASQAVSEWFNQPEPPTSKIHVGYVVRRAATIREQRLRREQRAIGGAPAPVSDTGPAVPPNSAYLRARAALVARLSDLDRLPSQRVAA